MTNLTVLAYFIYLPLVLVLTFYVARILFRNARVFMLIIFNVRTEIADSNNRLFEVGFYLLNVGFALWTMEMYDPMDGAQDMGEKLVGKVGGSAIYLGIMLLLHPWLFFRGKRKASEARLHIVPQVPPVQA